MSVLTKFIYGFNASPVRIPESYSVAIDKMILKFTWKGKIPKIAKKILKENKVGALILSDFKTLL